MSFDPQAFLDATMSEPLTKRPPINPGAYSALIGEPKTRAWTSRDGSKSGIALDVPLEITLDPNEATRVGQPTVIVSDSVMLDLTEAGGLDISPGKNRKLRNYREALNLNNPGDKFSFRMLQGRPIRVAVKHARAPCSCTSGSG
jgi:hypothetical protein